MAGMCACLGGMHDQGGMRGHGAWVARSMHAWGHALPRGAHGQEGVCAQGCVHAQGGMHGRGHAWPGMHPSPPPPVAQCAAGAHPTGMHYCRVKYWAEFCYV